jgi:hypothetical protein
MGQTYGSYDSFVYTHNGTNLTIVAYSGFPWAITIPSSIPGVNGTVTSIGDNAFSGSGTLTSVTIPVSVTNIGGQAFYGCSGLTNVAIPGSVTSIGEGAFSVCSGLTNVTIGNGVTSIGDEAFWGCSGLTGVTIPSSVTNIEDGAFNVCSGLTAITVDAQNPSYSSLGGVLFNKQKSTLVEGPGGKPEPTPYPAASPTSGTERLMGAAA